MLWLATKKLDPFANPDPLQYEKLNPDPDPQQLFSNLSFPIFFRNVPSLAAPTCCGSGSGWCQTHLQTPSPLTAT